MSTAKLKGNASGTGSVTIESPNTNSTRTLTLPDADGTLARTADIPAAGADTNLSNLSGTGENKVAQAWVTFQGDGTVTIKNSHNVSSITDNGTGDYTVNFSTAMPNSEYTVQGTSQPINSHGASDPRLIMVYRDSPSTTSVRIVNHGAQGVSDIIDGKRIYCTIFGD